MKVSVIIPTRNRATLLNRCLNRLLPQITYKDEIIIVDNASNNETKKVVSNFKSYSQISYYLETKIGPAHARNLGYLKSKNEILAFLDDDCMAAPNWLNHIKTTCKNEKIDKKINVYQGKIKHMFSERNLLSNIFLEQHKLSTKKIRSSQSWKEGKYINYLNAGNFFLNRKALDNLNFLFDAKNFPFIGEESDLAIRLQLLGYQIIYIPEVKVIHYKDKRRLIKSFMTSFHYGSAQGKLEEKYETKSQVKVTFRKMLGIDKQVNNKFVEIFTIAKRFRKRSWPSFFIIILYLLVKNTFFFLGKIYGKASIRKNYP